MKKIQQHHQLILTKQVYLLEKSIVQPSFSPKETDEVDSKNARQELLKLLDKKIKNGAPPKNLEIYEGLKRKLNRAFEDWDKVIHAEKSENTYYFYSIDDDIPQFNFLRLSPENTENPIGGESGFLSDEFEFNPKGHAQSLCKKYKEKLRIKENKKKLGALSSEVDPSSQYA